MYYGPHTEEDRQAMLAFLGAETVEDLFADIPPELRLGRPLELPEALDETALRRLFRGLAAKNADADRFVVFAGGGVADHYVPAAIAPLLARGEFLTAYTPYQPEVSQGTLAGIVEFQTMMCELTGLDVANASMYDGASAAAEAALLALDQTKRSRILCPDTLPPDVRATIRTYLSGPGGEVDVVPCPEGSFTSERLQAALAALPGAYAAVVVGYPNYFGIVEDLAALCEAAHRAGALAIAYCDPIALGLLESPGALGADVAVGDGQPLGNAMSFGGPSFGFFAARDRFIRRMPGRIAGLTRDLSGREGSVLTLQTREQHIRRARATSNICTNNALNALAAAIYLALLGPAGLREVATACVQNAHAAMERLRAAGARPAFPGPFFKEWVVELPDPREDAVDRVLAVGLARGVVAGTPLAREYPALSRHLLVCVTEARTREEVERLAAVIEEAASS